MRKVAGLLLLFNLSAQGSTVTATQIPHPLFLKLGFSSILEFSKMPIKVIIGDQQAFQIEKLEKSIIVRPLINYAVSNLFVYFKDSSPKLFTLTASEDSNPSLYNYFDLEPTKQFSSEFNTSSKANNKSKKVNFKNKEGVTLMKVYFDKSKDYLTIDFEISAGAEKIILPKWELIRLSNKDLKISPFKIWSERQEVQKDSIIKSRIIFLRPNVEKSLRDCFLIVPMKGREDVFHLDLSQRGLK